ncbi:MAG: hypothetical protein IJK98_03515 [Clostridia bacterium]|nr:hypothetical protein [Clostridia bacterium]
MKKLFCGLLIALFLLGAAACGSGDKTAPTTDPQQESAVPVETTAAEEPSAPADVTPVPTEEPTAARELNADIANRYLGIVARLYDQYGVGTINERGNFMKGVAFVKLLDLDGDGVEELICAYENPDRTIFPYVNEYAVYGPDSDEPLFDPQPVCNFGNGDAPGMGFLTKDGRVYLEYYDGSIEIRYSHLENGVLTTDIKYEEAEDFENGTVKAWLNGEEQEHETAYAALQAFEAGGVKEEIQFFDYDEVDALQKVRTDTNLTLDRLNTLGSAGL